MKPAGRGNLGPKNGMVPPGPGVISSQFFAVYRPLTPALPGARIRASFGAVPTFSGNLSTTSTTIGAVFGSSLGFSGTLTKGIALSASFGAADGFTGTLVAGATGVMIGASFGGTPIFAGYATPGSAIGTSFGGTPTFIGSLAVGAASNPSLDFSKPANSQYVGI